MLTSSAQPGNLPGFRVCIIGRRQLVVAKVEAVAVVLFNSGVFGSSVLKQAKTFLKNLTAATVLQFKEKGHEPFVVGQMPGTAVYLPPGYFFWELFGDAADYSGAKAFVFLTEGASEASVCANSEALLSRLKILLQGMEAKTDLVENALIMLSSLNSD